MSVVGMPQALGGAALQEQVQVQEARVALAVADTSSQVLQRQQVFLLHGNAAKRSEIAHLLQAELQYDVRQLRTSQDMLGAFYGNAAHPDAVIIDIASVPDAEQAIADLAAAGSYSAIIVLVDYGEYQKAAESLKLGAHDFITLPFAQERLAVTLRNGIALQKARSQAVLEPAMTNLAADKAAGQVDAIISLVSPSGETRKMQDIEQAVICFALRFYNGRMSEVARRLGIGRSTLYRKLDAMSK